ESGGDTEIDASTTNSHNETKSTEIDDTMPTTNSYKRNKSTPKLTTLRQHKFTQAKQSPLKSTTSYQRQIHTSETKSTEIDDIMPTTNSHKRNKVH
ncbi:29165_t:CDS:2, partial [Racocetra persica]